MSFPIIGSVDSIWRYPVKSMGGEQLSNVEVTHNGLRGDRAFALIDVATGKVVSAKNPRRWPGLLHFQACHDTTDRVIITFPNGIQYVIGDSLVDAALSTWFGRQVELRSLLAKQSIIEVCDPNANERVTEEEILSGTFFDASPVHLVTTATLRKLSQHYPGGLFDRCRFRPNLVIDCGDRTGFVENEWIGRIVYLGTDVRLRICGPCPRCIMTTLDQSGFRADRGILTAAATHNAGSVGVYAVVEQFGRISQGDEAKS